MYEIFKGDEIFQEYEMRSVLELSINKIVEKLLPYINSKEDAIILHRIIDITKQGIKIDNENIAHIAFEVKEYQIAIDYWDGLPDKPNAEKYSTAKAYTMQYPDNIPYLKDIKDFEEIINQYNKNKNVSLPNEILYIISEVLKTIWWKRGKSGTMGVWKLQQASFMRTS
jgi:GTP-binding protein EngB required for normal cell division